MGTECGFREMSVLEEASVMVLPQCTQRHGAVHLGL